MATTERLVLDLPSHLVAGLRESVRSGAYASESAAIEELLLAWYGPEGTNEPPIEQLRALIAESIADIDAGRFHDADEVHAELMAQIDAIAAKRAK